MKTAPILIADFNEEWQQFFEKERLELLRIFGDDLLYIEHVGSTSIPGLAAKPVIDIMAGINSLNKLHSHRAELESIGYREIETGMPERVFFQKDNRQFHLHVVSKEGFYERNEILFRDYLRQNKSFVEEYADLKRRLAGEMRIDHEGYTRAKTNFVQKVVDLACDEKSLLRRDVWES